MRDAEILAQEMARFDTFHRRFESGFRLGLANVASMINSLEIQTDRLVSIILDAPQDLDLERTARLCEARCTLLQKAYDKLEEFTRLRGFPEDADLLNQLVAIQKETDKVATDVRMIAEQYGVVPTVGN